MENTKKIIIGRKTFGISLILFGITLVIQTMFTLDILRYVLMIWPLIIVSLGIEIVYYSSKDKIDTKYDFWGTVLTGLVVVSGICFSIFNYGINKIFFSTEFQEYMTTNNTEEYSTYYCDNALKLSNMSDTKIDLKIIVDESISDTKAVVEYKFTEKSKTVLFDFFDNRDYIDYHISTSYNDDFTSMTILHMPQNYEYIKIKILTNNLDNVSTTGLFNIID